jgi:hypothetical protein
MIGAESPRNCGLTPGMGKRLISFLNFLDSRSDPHSLCSVGCGGFFPQHLSGQCVSMTTHIYLVPRLRKGGAVLPVNRMPKLGSEGFMFLHIFRRARKLSKSDY